MHANDDSAGPTRAAAATRGSARARASATATRRASPSPTRSCEPGSTPSASRRRGRTSGSRRIPTATSRRWGSTPRAGGSTSTTRPGASRRTGSSSTARSRLAESLPDSPSRRSRSTCAATGATRERALATAFRMLDTGSLRVGSERYAKEHGSIGLSTLLCAHATTHGDRVALAFPGKSHQAWTSEILDQDLARVVAAAEATRPERAPARLEGRSAVASALGAGDQRLRPGARGRRLHREGLPHPARHGRRRAQPREAPARSRRSGRAARRSRRPCATPPRSSATPRPSRVPATSTRASLDHYRAGETIDPSRPNSAETDPPRPALRVRRRPPWSIAEPAESQSGRGVPRATRPGCTDAASVGDSPSSNFPPGSVLQWVGHCQAVPRRRRSGSTREGGPADASSRRRVAERNNRQLNGLSVRRAFCTSPQRPECGAFDRRTLVHSPVRRSSFASASNARRGPRARRVRRNNKRVRDHTWRDRRSASD